MVHTPNPILGMCIRSLIHQAVPSFTQYSSHQRFRHQGTNERMAS